MGNEPTMGREIFGLLCAAKAIREVGVAHVLARRYGSGRLSQPLFIVRLADLERGKKHYDWELPLPWLHQVFAATEATAQAPGRLAFEASVTSRQVVVRGRAEAKVTMPCVRTLDPVSIDLAPELFLVLQPATTTQEVNKPAVDSRAKRSHRSKSSTEAVAATKPKSARRPEAELTYEEAAEDTYQGDQIELDAFVREFLLLELPMMPIRSDLRSEERPAIPPTPETPDGGESAHTVDPRLRPLAAIASRLLKSTKE